MKISASIIFLAFLAPIGTNASASNVEAKVSAENAIKQMRAYQDEAAKLNASSVFAELEKLRTVLALKQQTNKSIFLIDDDTNKATGYAMDLKARRDANDPYGSYYYGVYNLRVCGGLESTDTGRQFTDAVKKCFLESLESFKIASTSQIGEASFNIGRMYEKGWGVSPSKFVSAEWFAKAARQFNESGARDESLASIEAALNLVPDHPEALRLKKAKIK